MDMYVGLVLILCSICIYIFPPKFGNDFYGITTKRTLLNETAWATGQKIFAVAIIAMGTIDIILGNLKLRDQIPYFVKFILLIVLWKVSKYIVDKALEKMYPPN